MEQAQRDRQITMKCVCRLRISDSIAEALGVTHDSCGTATSGPDEPLCDMCIRVGHHKQPNFDPTIKGGNKWKPSPSTRTN